MQIQRGKEFFALKENTMNKEKSKKQKTKNVLEMPVVHPYSAGIDISDREHVVAVAEGLSDNRTRAFGSMTSDLEVSTETRTFRFASASTTGIIRPNSSSAETGALPGRVDSPPMSSRSAPSSTRRKA